MENLGSKRERYLMGELNEKDLAQDPIIQFERWYQDAEKAQIEEPNGMTLATVSSNGQPSARIVLLKGFGQKGFAFYTNYNSRKGQELNENPQAALVFWYKELQRQIRITGTVEKLSYDASLSYFHSRPKGSQLSALASPQSEIITKENMIQRRTNIEEKYKDENSIPLPDHWGGYLLKPTDIEFWQGRDNRLHDRMKYTLSDNGKWGVVRLAP